MVHFKSGETAVVRFSAAECFLSAAKDLGTLSVLLLLLLVGGPLLEPTHVQFLEVCSKVARFLISSQNPSNILQRCVQELPDFVYSPPK